MRHRGPGLGEQPAFLGIDPYGMRSEEPGPEHAEAAQVANGGGAPCLLHVRVFFRDLGDVHLQRAACVSRTGSSLSDQFVRTVEDRAQRPGEADPSIGRTVEPAVEVFLTGKHLVR